MEELATTAEGQLLEELEVLRDDTVRPPWAAEGERKRRGERGGGGRRGAAGLGVDAVVPQVLEQIVEAVSFSLLSFNRWCVLWGGSGSEMEDVRVVFVALHVVCLFAYSVAQSDTVAELNCLVHCLEGVFECVGSGPSLSSSSPSPSPFSYRLWDSDSVRGDVVA